MSALFKKLNFKAQKSALILNAPEEFAEHRTSLGSLVAVSDSIDTTVRYDFIIVFVYTNEDIKQFAEQLENQLEEDAILWYAYIKKSSKKHKTQLARGSDDWQILGNQGYEGVRQVAIDADWSALRFRQAKFIKTMKRGFAMSKEGKARTAKS